jgi:membrane protein YqaA with SNARE-associated domain
VSPTFRHLLAFFIQYGALGLFLLGLADDSFLFLPVGSDLLMVILVARNAAKFPLYIAGAAVGSACGVYLLDLVCRKSGEKGLTKIIKPNRLQYLKDKIEKHGLLVLIVACLAPPPFPFGAFIAAASALQFPRLRLLTIVLLARAARYALVGWAALYFGRHILRVTRTPEFLWIMGVFIAICLVGSAIEGIRWFRVGRTA